MQLEWINIELEMNNIYINLNSLENWAKWYINYVDSESIEIVEKNDKVKKCEIIFKKIMGW